MMDTNQLKFDNFSNSDEGGGAILDDLTLLSAGYALVLVFVTIVLGRFNMVQHKVSNFDVFQAENVQSFSKNT